MYTESLLVGIFHFCRIIFSLLSVSCTSTQYTFYRKTNETTFSLGSLQGTKVMDNSPWVRSYTWLVVA